MRLIKVGRDQSCDLRLNSPKVSSLHAEITILNNGDMLLEDKGSTNGTYIMNRPIKPGTQVPISRGDAVRFGDTELVWSMIPPMEDLSRYKGIYGIGKHSLNEIRLDGATVSRFHATLKKEKDDKVYIEDHSKNGTTVNGEKLAFGQRRRIKRGDTVVCGGVTVPESYLKSIIPNSVWPKIVAAFGGVATVVGLIFIIIELLSRPSLEDLQEATACVYGQYYIEVELEDDPLSSLYYSYPKTWKIGYRPNTGWGEPQIGLVGVHDVQPFEYTGTAFFISENGDLGTNRHVACPWELEYVQKEIRENTKEILTWIKRYVEYNCDSKMLIKDDIFELRLITAKLKISGVHNFLGIALTGSNVNSIVDYKPCQVIALSDDSRKDVALIRLNDPQTPEGIIEGGFFDIDDARIDEMSLEPQKEELITIGYPAGFAIGFNMKEGKELSPIVHKISLSKRPDEFNFQLQGQAIGGQSGSPIIDENHRLVGVLFATNYGTDFSYGCNIKHLVDIYNKHKLK